MGADTMGADHVKIGVQLQQQGSTVDAVLSAARDLDNLGVDSLWVADHFFPVYGDRDGTSFEAYSLLSAIAAVTSNATVGALVASVAYRNPDLHADAARTIDHISGGRFVLGVGAGWFERDFDEYGFEFGTTTERLSGLRESIGRIQNRLAKLNPAPLGRMPVMIGGSGPKVTLRIVAEHADMWNAFGPADEYARLNTILDDWCLKVRRDAKEIERTVAISLKEAENYQDFIDAGATHLIVMSPAPHDTEPIQRLIEAARHTS